MELKLLLMGFVCAVAALMAAATYAKWREVQAASRWLPTPGKIVSSRSVAREVTKDGAREIRNVAAIAFDYAVNGRTLRGTRHSLREDVGNTNVAETLARYPKGAVVTVFYDPADPTKALIERTMPEGSFAVMIYLTAGLVVGAIALLLVIGGGSLDAIRSRLPRPENAGAAVLLAGMGLFALRFGFLQKAMADAARTWPAAKGSIGASGIETVTRRAGLSSHWSRSWRTVFRSRVIYTYVVAGQTYVGDQVSFGADVTSSLPGLIGGRARRYPQGSPVAVFYDPANPSVAVLERRVLGLWILWAAAALCLGGAGMLVGFI